MKTQGRHAGRLTTTAAVALMLLCPFAWSAPGDLDPAFGDIGRVTELPGLLGDVWSIEPQGEAFILAGDGFTARIAKDGSIDTTFARAIPQEVSVYDIVAQRDGHLIGVGSGITAFRLTASGALDASFGDGGFASVPADLGFTSGTSVVIDESGRAVIAGRSGERVVALRLLANGDIDGTFGDAGVVIVNSSLGRSGLPWVSPPRLVRIPDGYRITLNRADSELFGGRPMCSVVALRDDGAPDSTFGPSGLTMSSNCAALAAQSDGRFLVAGHRGGSAFAIRLLSNGELDSGFNADDATAKMSTVMALVAAPDGSVLMAGRAQTGVSGALVLRLGMDGRLDMTFGKDGEAWVDLPSWNEGGIIQDIRPLAEGDIVLAGGVPDGESRRPFVARLLGSASGSNPGVVGVKRFLVDATPDSNQAVVTVRRTGGSAGAVSVAYQTQTNPDATSPALEGQDYMATSGRLTWAHQDSQDKQIVVQLLGEIDGNPENDRTFEVQLSDVQGGGLGSAIATVNTGFLAAILRIDPTDLTVDESQGTISLNLVRDTNVAGMVSATVTASADTAIADSDYRFEPTIIEWADGDASIKTVSIPIVDDDAQESSESFTVSITGATNGALIGDPSVTRITINDDDQGDNSGGGSQGGSSGGGQFGLFPMILLGFAGVFRVVQQRLGRHSAPQKE